MISLDRARSTLLLSAMLLAAAPAPAQQNPNLQAALNFRFSAAEIEAVVHARNALARAIATTPGLGDQIVAASAGNPTVDEVIARLKQIPQVKRSYNNAGLTTRQGVLSELALMLTAQAYQNSQQNPGAPAITPAMAANLQLYQKYSGQLIAWQSEIAGRGPVVDPDIVGVAGAYPDNVRLQNDADVQQPGNVNVGKDVDVQKPGNVNVSKDVDVQKPGNVNMAKDVDVQQPGNVNMAKDVDVQQPGNESPTDPDMVNPIVTDPDNVSP
ncbi:MAG: hypothetical protein H6Q77_126 [Gemmatimonadetes bacterium]|nr:hypothetical protein [Gemmatimonadota bacterium]